MIELGIALLLHTQSVSLKPQPKVAIVLSESNYDKRQREEREYLEKSRRIASKASYGESKGLYPDSTNNCVLWAKRQTNINRPLGAGGRGAVQGTEPKIGAIGVQKSIVHAVVVVAVNGDQITIQESNFKKGWITQRVLNINEFIGFIYG